MTAFQNYDFPNQFFTPQTSTYQAMNMANWLQTAPQLVLQLNVVVMVIIFGVTFPALEIQQNGDGSWVMQTLGESPRGAIGTMITVLPSEIVGYVSPNPPYFEAHSHGGISAGGATSGLPKAPGT